MRAEWVLLLLPALTLACTSRGSSTATTAGERGTETQAETSPPASTWQAADPVDDASRVDLWSLDGYDVYRHHGIQGSPQLVESLTFRSVLAERDTRALAFGGVVLRLRGVNADVTCDTLVVTATDAATGEAVPLPPEVPSEVGRLAIDGEALFSLDRQCNDGGGPVILSVLLHQAGADPRVLVEVESEDSVADLRAWMLEDFVVVAIKGIAVPATPIWEIYAGMPGSMVEVDATCDGGTSAEFGPIEWRGSVIVPIWCDAGSSLKLFRVVAPGALVPQGEVEALDVGRIVHDSDAGGDYLLIQSTHQDIDTSTSWAHLIDLRDGIVVRTFENDGVFAFSRSQLFR